VVHHGRCAPERDSPCRDREPADEKLVSAGSLWEMAIKVSLGKLKLAEPFGQLIPRELTRNGFQILPLSIAHVEVVSSLPFLHRDPFDRLLVAQSQVEGFPIISSDQVLDGYGVRRLW
jgi:PIN domain nuclease of toxin-antitoxin system